MVSHRVSAMAPMATSASMMGGLQRRHGADYIDKGQPQLEECADHEEGWTGDTCSDSDDMEGHRAITKLLPVVNGKATYEK